MIGERGEGRKGAVGAGLSEEDRAASEAGAERFERGLHLRGVEPVEEGVEGEALDALEELEEIEVGIEKGAEEVFVGGGVDALGRGEVVVGGTG